MNRRLRTTVACAALLGLAASVAITAPAAARPVATVGTATTAALATHRVRAAERLPARGHRDRLAAVRVLRLPRQRGPVPGQPDHRQGQIFSPGPGTPSLGMKVDLRGRLFVAGGSGGNARVVNAFTGEVLASYAFATGGDLRQRRDPHPAGRLVHRLAAAGALQGALRPHGRLPDAARSGRPADAGTSPRTRLQRQRHLPHPDGRGLIIVQSAPACSSGSTRPPAWRPRWTSDRHAGAQRRRPAAPGPHAVRGAEPAQPGGRVRPERRRHPGARRAGLTDPRLDVPATVAAFGDRLYLANARFTTPPTPTTPYNSIAIPRP